MATASCTLTFERTMDSCYPDSGANYHFGYGKAGQTWCTCYKCVVSSYSGTPSSITITLNVNRGTAYPTDKNSTWKVGLDPTAPIWSAADGEYSAGSAYADGLYSRTGSWIGTFSGSITSTTVAKTVTISTNSSILDGGNTFYIYLFSGANAYNSIKVSSISASVTYSTESVTGTNLVVGTTSSPSATYCYPTPAKRTVYWKVTGLQNQIKDYTGFYLYLSSGFSFTQGQTTAPSGTQIASYSSTTSTAKEFTQSFTVPNTNIKITNGNIGVVCVARNASGYWRIGGSSNSPKTCYIKLAATDWFSNAFSIIPKVTGTTTATINVTHNSVNNPKYAKYVCLGTASASTTGQSSEPAYSGYTSLTNSSSSGSTYTISKTGLTAGTTHTFYPHADADTSYASYGYYGLGAISFTTDPNYSATLTASVTGTTTATIGATLSTTTNSNGNIYYSTSSGLSSPPSTYFSNGGSKSLTGLSVNTSYTYYFYAYSAVTKKLYSVGSKTFRTDPNYSATLSVSSVEITTATIGATLNTTNNSDGKIYYSTSSGLTSKNNLPSFSSGGTANLTGLAASTSYTYYIYAYSSTSGKLYQLDSEPFTTKAAVGNYTGTLAATATGAQKATFTLTGPSDTTGLNSNWYLSTTNSATTTSLANVSSATRGNTITITNLSPAASNTRYAYVYNTSTSTYYQIASITVKTHSYVYYGASLTPCWTYLGQPDGTLQQVIIYP